MKNPFTPIVRAVRARGTRLAERVRRRRAVVPISQLGVALVVTTISSWLLAFFLGWKEATLIAAVGLLLLVSGIPFLFRRGDFSARLSAAPDRVTVGEPSLGAVTITNEGGVRSLPQKVELKMGTSLIRFEVGSIAGGESVDQPFVVPTDRRAVIDIGPVTMVRGDPLGIYRRDSTYTDIARVFVHPHRLMIPPMSLGWVRDVDGPTFDNSPRGDVAFHTIREYVPGDDMRHVHWKSTARTGTMMVRQYVDNRRPQIALIIDEYRGAYGTAEEFERALEIVASIEEACLRAGQEVVHHRGKRRVVSTVPSTFLDDLAGAALQPNDQLLPLSNRAVALDGSSTVGVIVTGSTVRPEVLQRATRHIERAMRSIVVQIVPGRGQMRESAQGVSMRVATAVEFARLWTVVCAQ